MSAATPDPTPDPTPQSPPEHATLIPISSFSAFHGNYTGIERTGEMKLSLIIPISMIPEAMKIAVAARKEVLWVEVSKLEYLPEGDTGWVKTLQEQEEERRKLNQEGNGGIDHPELGFSE